VAGEAVTRSVRISWKTARAILSHVGSCAEPGFFAFEAELRAAMAPKRAVVAAKKRKAAKKTTKKEQTAAIRDAVMNRAGLFCEGCASMPLYANPLTLDHFFGRVRVKQSERNCWALCLACHRQKTNNNPSAERWLERFITHAEAHGYREEAGMATRRLASLELSNASAAVGR
jgi:5-methylcytosine-specific restriction endonuclease McrA